ncbi:MAG TPA: VOC family protein [Gemmatimonadales bacterium]|jgi:uncharacterized glyoxalase superfamily protein PhnB
MAAKKKKAAKKAVKKTAKRPASRSKVRRRQPETLRLRQLAPSFTVNDANRSLAWYTNVLGFVVKDRWENNGVFLGAELRAGDLSLMIGQDDFKKGKDRVYGVGVRIYCRTAQDIDLLAKEIKARGGTLDHEPEDQPWGERDFGVTDPDGYKITISSMRH